MEFFPICPWEPVPALGRDSSHRLLEQQTKTANTESLNLPGKERFKWLCSTSPVTTVAGGSDSKECAAMWGGEVPWVREWLPTLGFLPGEPHRERSLAGYSWWGHKDSNTPEWLTFSLSFHFGPGKEEEGQGWWGQKIVSPSNVSPLPEEASLVTSASGSPSQHPVVFSELLQLLVISTHPSIFQTVMLASSLTSSCGQLPPCSTALDPCWPPGSST